MLFIFQSVMPILETKWQLKWNSYKTNPIDPVSKSPWLRCCCCSLSARDRSSVISHLIGSFLPLLVSHLSLLQIRLAHCIESPPFLLESKHRFKKGWIILYMGLLVWYLWKSGFRLFCSGLFLPVDELKGKVRGKSFWWIMYCVMLARTGICWHFFHIRRHFQTFHSRAPAHALWFSISKHFDRQLSKNYKRFKVIVVWRALWFIVLFRCTVGGLSVFHICWIV